MGNKQFMTWVLASEGWPSYISSDIMDLLKSITRDEITIVGYCGVSKPALKFMNKCTPIDAPLQVSYNEENGHLLLLNNDLTYFSLILKFARHIIVEDQGGSAIADILLNIPESLYENKVIFTTD